MSLGQETPQPQGSFLPHCLPLVALGFEQGLELARQVLPLEPHPQLFALFYFSGRVSHFCSGQPQTEILLPPPSE
jgi:hypothetical protein